MTQQTTTPPVVEDDLQIEIRPEVPSETRPPAGPSRTATTGLFLLAAFVVAVAFGAWLAARDSTPDLAPSEHDSVISGMVREQQAFVGGPSTHDAMISQLLRQRQAAVAGSQHDAVLEQLLRERQGGAEPSDHDAAISRLMQE